MQIDIVDLHLQTDVSWPIVWHNYYMVYFIIFYNNPLYNGPNPKMFFAQWNLRAFIEGIAASFGILNIIDSTLNIIQIRNYSVSHFDSLQVTKFCSNSNDCCPSVQWTQWKMISSVAAMETGRLKCLLIMPIIGYTIFMVLRLLVFHVFVL